MSKKYLLIFFCAFFQGCTTTNPAQQKIVTTNGNGRPTDVGAWYQPVWDDTNPPDTVNQRWDSWDGWGCNFRPWTKGSDRAYSFRKYDGCDTAVIDEHLALLTSARIDFILFDATNTTFPPACAAVCRRIKIWNNTHNWKIKYAFAVRPVGPSGLNWGGSIEEQAKQAYKMFYNNSEYQSSQNYYQLNGKPLLVVWNFTSNPELIWKEYNGEKEYSNYFTLSWGGRTYTENHKGYSGPGDYGWQMDSTGVKLNSEVEMVMPGWSNHPGPYGPKRVKRNNGNYYRNCWNTVLSNPLPRIVLINSFNCYEEETAVWTAETDMNHGASAWPIETWTDVDGVIHPSMYWDMTVNYIKKLDSIIYSQKKLH